MDTAAVRAQLKGEAMPAAALRTVAAQEVLQEVAGEAEALEGVGQVVGEMLEPHLPRPLET